MITKTSRTLMVFFTIKPRSNSSVPMLREILDLSSVEGSGGNGLKA